MTDEKYNEVFELIKINLMPKNQFDESQKEVSFLKSALECATNDLKKMNSQYEEQKLANDILQAEKQSLEAEKKTFEFKFNEVSLKLKQKTFQYDSLLNSQRNGCKPKVIDQGSTGTQKVKEEHQEIGKVNFPISSSSRQDELATKTGTKRTHSSIGPGAKRTKTEIFDSKSQTNRELAKNKQIFNCFNCLDNWGRKICIDFDEDPDADGAPDLQQKIPIFSSFLALKDHYLTIHDAEDCCCEEIDCLLYRGHNGDDNWPHGDIQCRICNLSLKYKDDLDKHMQFDHIDHSRMSNKEIYDLWLK